MYGRALDMRPTIGSSDGSSSSLHTIWYFWSIPTNTMNINDFAKASPGQRLRPKKTKGIFNSIADVLILFRNSNLSYYL